jgi:hypothetical protein
MNALLRIWLVAGCLVFAGSSLAEEAAEEAAETPEQEAAEETEYSDRVLAELAQRKLRLGEPVDRILQHLISGWHRIDNQHMILTVGVSKKYLVRLNRYCRGLDNSESVQFTSVGSDLTDHDQIKVRYSMGVDNCPIDEIRKLEKIEKEESGKAEGDAAE